ncbi:MAG: tRNA (adenosine(37)-N6)-threonylcarbamoyltransferase complex dimerization subunit type 1 TsaB, partial [Pseudolabrys sp.]
MRVLAIDTALEACSVAVLDTSRADQRVHESVPMQRGHAEALMPLVARVLERAQIDFTALDRIAVTTGPGSFTGLRVGIAAARGIALATGKPAIGLTTLAAFAAPFIAADDTLPVVVAIDARHDHVYLQVFGPGGRTVVAPRVAPLREALRVSTSGAPRITGTAASRLAA